jgi:hypothetical protein
MGYFFIGLALVSLLSFVYGSRFIAPHLKDPVERFGSQRLYRFGLFLLVLPVLILLIVFCLIFFIWQTESSLRFAHLLWVLGLWMLGTLCMFVFLLSVRLKLKAPKFAIIFPLVIIPVAIYSTPLPVFQRVFNGLILIPALIGILNITLVWAYEFHFFKLVNQLRKN